MCHAACAVPRHPAAGQSLRHFTPATSLLPHQHTVLNKVSSLRLSQVRRSTYHDVVRAGDLTSLGIDTSGIQIYSINNARVSLRIAAAPGMRFCNMLGDQLLSCQLVCLFHQGCVRGWHVPHVGTHQRSTCVYVSETKTPCLTMPAPASAYCVSGDHACSMWHACQHAQRTSTKTNSLHLMITSSKHTVHNLNTRHLSLSLTQSDTI